eukprot:3635059-Amphidinium_carterae.1
MSDLESLESKVQNDQRIGLGTHAEMEAQCINSRASAAITPLSYLTARTIIFQMRSACIITPMSPQNPPDPQIIRSEIGFGG